MITFDNLWATMEKKGMSTYRLRETCDVDNKTIRRLRANENVETKTLDKLGLLTNPQHHNESVI